ncbi:MAG: hypothetical protein ACTSP6_02090 [Promethearchaeota archaeon]
MSIRHELVQHYPWLPSLENLYPDIASKNPNEFISDIFSNNPVEIQERILGFFKASFDNLEQIDDYKIDELNIHVYLIIKILLYLLDDKSISNRIANLYSKVTYSELVKEDDAYLYDICKDLNLDLLYYQVPVKYGIIITKDQQEDLYSNFRIHYTDYLRLAVNLRDDFRKLINNPLSEGYVFIQKRNLSRLLQEFVREKFFLKDGDDKSSIEALKKKLLKIKEFNELHERILANWELKKEDFEYSIEFKSVEGSEISTNFPPCIKEILSKIQEGQNLIHNERLFIVWFLIAVNYQVDTIINLFSSMPDFNREKTAYQVNYAKKKKYTPYKCSTLKSFNLCMAKKFKDKLCLEGFLSRKLNEQKFITHPLFYVKFNQYQNFKKSNSGNLPKK